MRPLAVPSHELDHWLPKISWHLESFCRNGQWQPDDLVDQIRRREKQLWLVVDEEIHCAMLTSVLADRLNTVLVSHCAGDRMRDWVHLWPVVENWARHIGAKRVEAITRPGWERVLKKMGMKKTHIILEKRL